MCKYFHTHVGVVTNISIYFTDLVFLEALQVRWKALKTRHLRAGRFDTVQPGRRS